MRALIPSGLVSLFIDDAFLAGWDRSHSGRDTAVTVTSMAVGFAGITLYDTGRRGPSIMRAEFDRLLLCCKPASSSGIWIDSPAPRSYRFRG